MWCLTQKAIDLMKEKFSSGELDPEKLSDMDSSQRRGYFASFLGEPTASKVNAAFESKLLLKKQQKGILTWAQQVVGMKPERLRDIASTVMRMDKILTPEKESEFLHDLVSQRIGADVTYEEASKIHELSKVAAEAKKELEKSPNEKKGIEYQRRLMDVEEYVNSLKPKESPLSFSNIWNLPKTLLTAYFHTSAPIVQGWGLISTKAFWRSLPKMFKFWNEDEYKNSIARIRSHPYYKMSKKAHLGLTKLGDNLTQREESIQSSILEHIPGLDIPAKSFSRMFTGFLNELRFNRFVDLVNAAKLHGEDVAENSKVASDLADVVNNFSGRANLGENDKFAGASSFLNVIFFAPRKILATINMFNPERYLNPEISAEARKAAIRQLAGSVIATFSFLQLAHLAGADVDFDPRSQNFGKIVLGKTKIDVTGGNAGYVRMLVRLMGGKTKTSYGDVRSLNVNERMDEAKKWLFYKFAPSTGVLWDGITAMLSGKEFNVGKEAMGKMLPIFTQDITNLAMYDANNIAAWASLPIVLLGGAMQTQEPGSEWESSSSKVLTEFRDKVGQKKSDEANEEFDNRFHGWMKKIENNPEFKNMSEDDKQSLIRSERNKLEKNVLKERGFEYKPKKRNKSRFSILEKE